MPAYQTHTHRFGEMVRQEQAADNLLLCVEPTNPFSSEARKGQLYILVEADMKAPRSPEACETILRTIRKEFYSHSSFSVTSALRYALHSANVALYKQNVNLPPQQRVSVGITCAVLHEDDLYIGQVTPCQAFVFHEGKMRAFPSSTAWRITHKSVLGSVKPGSLGSSLSVEPELYRSTVKAGSSILLCSSDLGLLLDTSFIQDTLSSNDPNAISAQIEARIVDADKPSYGLVIALLPPLSQAARNAPLSPAGIGERTSLTFRNLGEWFSDVVNETVQIFTKREKPKNIPRSERTTIKPDGLSPNPIERPRPIDLGPTFEERQKATQSPEFQIQQRFQAEQKRYEAARLNQEHDEEAPPSSFLGEYPTDLPTNMRRIDLSDLLDKTPTSHPYQAQHQIRPLVDMTWSERLMLPFVRLREHFAHRQAMPRLGDRPRYPQRNYATQAYKGSILPPKRESPPFPWLLLLVLVLLVTSLVLYGMNQSRNQADEALAEFLALADQRVAEVRSSPNDQIALERLDVLRDTLEQIRVSPLVTTTNITVWNHYQELLREYERAQTALQRLSFLEDPQILTTHPLPNGRFHNIVVPPQVATISDTNALRYIYMLDSSSENTVLYRAPFRGGTTETFLRPNDPIGDTVVGSVRAQAWREDNIIAIDQSPGGFSYFFRNNNQWAFSQLAGSELWATNTPLDIEIYDGNLYVWGAEANQILKYTSGSYANLPTPWIRSDQLGERDFASSIDMEIDGNIYLLQANGTVFVLSGGAFEREIVPEGISPPISAVTRFFVTGGPTEGHIFLVDTLNERIIQIDKMTGVVIQQIRVAEDSPIRLDFLTDVYVEDSIRPILYIVNGGQIIRADLPTPPRPFQSSPMPTATPEANQ
jgi:hypothetical protein